MEDRLLHPNLLQTHELRTMIKDLNFITGNIDEIPRSELIELFKKYIMPKPQRRKSTKIEENSCYNLVKEVKKIKLNRNNQQDTLGQPMDCSPPSNSSLKRQNVAESNQNTSKRQRIQWP